MDELVVLERGASALKKIHHASHGSVRTFCGKLYDAKLLDCWCSGLVIVGGTTKSWPRVTCKRCINLRRAKKSKGLL